MRDRVTPAVHAAVLSRDGTCFLYRLDRDHVCKNQWGVVHPPDDHRWLTLDHVKDKARMGKRAASDSAHLVAMCWAGNVGGPSKAVRQAERAYLGLAVPV